MLRFSLYYRAASPLAPPWEVVAADVDLSAGRGPPQLLLNTTLSGEIERQGELATLERDASTMTCVTDADCDDRRSCNGHERCAPRTGRRRARLREGQPGGVSREPGVQRRARLHGRRRR